MDITIREINKYTLLSYREMDRKTEGQNDGLTGLTGGIYSYILTYTYVRTFIHI
jgi:hypothetical protein